MVQKGKISAVLNGGKFVTVTPFGGGIVTAPLTVPFFLIGALPVGIAVAYATFGDGTGIVISRMDGEWNHDLNALEGQH